MELIQLVLNGVVATLFTILAISSTIQAGEFCWWQIIFAAIVLLLNLLVGLSVKEYKQSKQ